MTDINVTCIGGGHGLGHLLETIDDFEFVSLTGIVTTTDNGGSTGRLRESCDTISWGDIRYCLSKLSKVPSTKSLLLEYRFEHLGELSGHSLGNLMFCAVDSLCIRPTETVKVMKEFLGIKANILPMSDTGTHLISHCAGHSYFGEVDVDDNADQGITKLSLAPAVKPSEEVLLSLKTADVLFLGPGSFYTSTLPTLLMDGIIEVINQNDKLKIYFITNVEDEFPNQPTETAYQLEFFQSLGLTKTIHSLIPSHRVSDETNLCKPYIIADLPADPHGRHHHQFYKKQLLELFRPYT
jgi:uncharacterized cofD-like protein